MYFFGKIGCFLANFWRILEVFDEFWIFLAEFLSIFSIFGKNVFFTTIMGERKVL